MQQTPPPVTDMGGIKIQTPSYPSYNRQTDDGGIKIPEFFTEKKNKYNYDYILFNKSPDLDLECKSGLIF